MLQHDSHHALSEVFFGICKGIDSPISLGAWLRFRSGEFKQLIEMSIVPRDYHNVEAFKRDYLIVNFLAKYKGFKTGIDLRAKATSSFVSSELKCALVNRSLKQAAVNGFERPLTGSVVFTAARKIARLLGDLKIGELLNGGGWGPGAAVDIPRRRAFADLKMTEVPISVSSRCLLLADAEIRADLHWSASVLRVNVEDILGPFSFRREEVFEIYDYARYTTVPKSAKTDRSILVEPRMNGFLQKGVGSFIRKRLSTVGVDLNDQSINQNWAALARDLELATIDLSAASDSIARELVFTLLPVDWACFLDLLRSGSYKDGETITKLEKFSSMGNGFTFELESLIFWAITASVTDLTSPRRPLSIYGDDIICGQEVAGDLINVLNDLGFAVNLEKSYVDGEFFESCGRHYFFGVEVTPIYQKEVIENVQEHSRLANRILRCAARFSVSIGGFWPPLEAGWRAALRGRKAWSDDTAIPFGTEGDDGWLMPHAEYDFAERVCENRGFRCRIWRQVATSLPGDAAALYAYALRKRSSSKPSLLGLGDASSPGRGDDVSLPSTSFAKGWRWVTPDGNFARSWT